MEFVSFGLDLFSQLLFPKAPILSRNRDEPATVSVLRERTVRVEILEPKNPPKFYPGCTTCGWETLGNSSTLSEPQFLYL